jgi:hypothetical protein
VSLRTWRLLTGGGVTDDFHKREMGEVVCKGVVKKLRGPVNPLESTAPAPSPPPVARILHPSNITNDKGKDKENEKDKEKDKEKEREKEGGEGKKGEEKEKEKDAVWVTWKKGVLDGHVIFLGEGGVGEWGWGLVSVRYVLSLSLWATSRLRINWFLVKDIRGSGTKRCG